MSTIEIQVPDIGDFDEVAVIELLVKPGDTVKLEQSLLTVESDKASMEIPSSHAGVVKELRVKIGDKVKQGSVVLTLEAAGAAPSPAPAAAAPASTPAPVLEQKVAVAVMNPAKADTNSVTSRIEVKVPDIGDFKDVAVIEVFVKAGDAIKVEQSLVTVESDKAAMEIPSSHAGVLKELKVKVGDKINIGDLLAILEAAAPAGAVTASAAQAAQVSEHKVPTSVTETAQSAPFSAAPIATVAPAHNPMHNPVVAPSGALPHASPSVRKFARELGVPLD
jgi:pyruvate dehydrogenase E2 component (dihydrolipoamide acetyltransferase)